MNVTMNIHAKKRLRCLLQFMCKMLVSCLLATCHARVCFIPRDHLLCKNTTKGRTLFAKNVFVSVV